MNYDNGITPREARREMRRWFPTAVIGTVLLMTLGIIIAVMGSKAEFWVNTQNAKNQAGVAKINTQIQQNGIGFQEGQLSALQQQIGNIANLDTEMIGASNAMVTALHSQVLADARLGCTAASLVTSVPADEQGWVTQNCANGALSPTSPLYK